MSRPKILYFSASRASQDMCQKPTVSRGTSLEYAAGCTHAKDVLDLFAGGKTFKDLSNGQRLYLESIPGWRNYLPPHLFN